MTSVIDEVPEALDVATESLDEAALDGKRRSMREDIFRSEGPTPSIGLMMPPSTW